MQVSRMQAQRVAISLAAAVALFGIALSAITLSRGSTLVAPFWPTNALALVLILRWKTTRTEGLCLLGATFIAICTATLIGGASPDVAVELSAFNIIEIGTAVLLVRRFATTVFHTVAEGWRFFFMAGLFPSLVGAACVLALGIVTDRADALASSLTWTSAHLLGFVLVGPLGMTISRRELAKLHLRRRWPEALAVFGLLIVATFGVFVQNRLPLLSATD